EAVVGALGEDQPLRRGGHRRGAGQPGGQQRCGGQRRGHPANQLAPHGAASTWSSLTVASRRLACSARAARLAQLPITTYRVQAVPASLKKNWAPAWPG